MLVWRSKISCYCPIKADSWSIPTVLFSNLRGLYEEIIDFVMVLAPYVLFTVPCSFLVISAIGSCE